MAMSMNRSKLEGLVGDLLERTKEPCRSCLKAGGVLGAGTCTTLN